MCRSAGGPAHLTPEKLATYPTPGMHIIGNAVAGRLAKRAALAARLPKIVRDSLLVVEARATLFRARIVQSHKILWEPCPRIHYASARLRPVNRVRVA